MKHLKMFALAAVAAGALMAFLGASTASATVLCSNAMQTGCTSKWPVGKELDFSVPSGTSLSLVSTSNEPINTCKEGTVEGTITNAGSATSTVTGELKQKEGTIAKTGLTWGGCEFPTKTLSATGKLEIHKTGTTGNGILTGDSTIEVTINTFIFGSCVYGVTAGTKLGELTEGNPAVFHANAVAERFSGSGIACPETALWTGTYTQTAPAGTTLYVGES